MTTLQQTLAFVDLVHATSLQRINCEDGRYRLQGDNQAIPLAQAGVVYYSEEMMAFIRDLQAAFGSPPRFLRQASKRSEDFWHKRTYKPAGSPRISLGELFSYVNLNVRGVDCAIQHHAVASGDLGEVHARPEDVKCVPASHHNLGCSVLCVVGT